MVTAAEAENVWGEGGPKLNMFGGEGELQCYIIRYVVTTAV